MSDSLSQDDIKNALIALAKSVLQLSEEAATVYETYDGDVPSKGVSLNQSAALEELVRRLEAIPDQGRI